MVACFCNSDADRGPIFFSFSCSCYLFLKVSCASVKVALLFCGGLPISGVGVDGKLKKREKRETRWTIADAIVVEIDRSCLRIEQL